MKPLLAAVLAQNLLAGDAGEDVAATPPGLRAEVFAGADFSGEPALVRVDPDVHFEWEAASPDPRLPPGPFAARWSGKVFVEEEGDLRLSAFVEGSVRVTVSGRVAIEGARSGAGWVPGASLHLEHGLHDIVVLYRRTGERGRLGIFQESAGFALEPLGERSFFQPAAEAPPDAFERGHRLVRRLRCAACHAIPGVPAPPRAPALGGTRLLWKAFESRLCEPEGSLAHGGSMPGFGLSREDAASIAAFIRTVTAGVHEASTDLQHGWKEGGFEAVITRGCLACHTTDGVGAGRRFAGGNLQLAGAHRSERSLVDYLTVLVGDSSGHRPRLGLTAEEARSAAAYLSALHIVAPPPDAPPGDAIRGRELVRALRCSACHDVPGEERAPLVPWAAREGTRGCTGPERTPRGAPRYSLTGDERRAVDLYLALAHPETSLPAFEEGRLLLEEKGCVSCHARGFRQGIAPVAAELAARGLREIEGALRPPALDGVGDKLLDGALARAVVGELGARRPWLEARMPVYAHGPGEAEAIARFLRGRDRVPPGLDPLQPHAGADAPFPSRGELLAAGRILAGPEGLACSACHALGKHQPGGIAPTARGPDLLRVGERVHRGWFSRFVRDPSRSAPGIEMPGFVSGRRGILGGNLEHQIEALWHALNADGFSLASGSGAVREVAAGPGLPVQVIRDVVRKRGAFGEGWIPRAMLVGLPSGHHLIHDAAAGAPVLWWTGAFARQLTEGKSWWWEPAGELVLALPPVPAIALERGGEIILARGDGVRASLSGWRRTGEGALEIEERLRFPGGLELWCLETISSDDGGAFTRRFAVRDAPEGTAPVLVAALPAPARAKVGGTRIEAESPGGAISITLPGGSSWVPREAGLDGASLFASALERAGDAWRGGMRYEAPGAERPAARPESTPARRGAPADLPDVVPGFRAVRLPLEDSILPTSFATRSDGGVVLTTLSGDVLALRDGDGDGVEESADRIADRLSAPFGIAADGAGLVVSHKPEIARLEDRDGDGFLETARVLAASWGFTHDYHDWTFGLVRDGDGWLALTGSDYQQRGRDRSTTRLRGKAIRVHPDGAVEEVARGLRFAVGLARRADGEVFFTDNQGEGNPFNEIAHLVPGEAYGTPSLEDSGSDRMGGGRPAAIQVPHPWTRSVNGIAFLDAGGKFGALEGHGIGCEYDNAFLIRFTLERVRGVFQGACYPFSRRSPEGGLLGPVSCAALPGGRIYVGDMRESGWGGGANTGAVVRLEPLAELPPGILEVRAATLGFRLRFTRPVDAARAEEPASYRVSAYRRVYAGGYATPDADRHAVPVLRAARSADGREVELSVEALRAGFVYDIHAGSLASGGVPLWPAEAHYTMNAVP